MYTRLTRFSLLATLLAPICTARLQSEHITKQRETSSIFPGYCLEDAKECEPDTTCSRCCAGTSYTVEGTNTSACGYGKCLDDGVKCSNSTNWDCWRCCNGAYEDGGTTCGGQCLGEGKACDIDKTCNLCCDYKTVKIGDSYECGCLEDGKSCIPGENCYSCCNGAFADGGMTCGGTCIEDGKVCEPGEDCHMCCTYSTYWYSSGKMQCGAEPCYKDGSKCIPGQSCYNCCSGAAYNGGGTVCGGKCLKAGSKCTFLGTCNKCCSDYSENLPKPMVKAPRSTTPEYETTNSTSSSTDAMKMSYPIGGTSYWNPNKSSMVCGYEMCLKDGTKCIPGYDCYKCCNGAYSDNGSTCGGTCLKTGTKCNFYGNCSQCCVTSKYNTTLGYYKCAEYDEYPIYPMPKDDGESTITKHGPKE